MVKIDVLAYVIAKKINQYYIPVNLRLAAHDLKAQSHIAKMSKYL